MKAMMSWSDTLSVGDPEIDEQHRTLIRLLNEAYDAMLECRSREVTGRLLGDLAAYTRLHFRYEERYFGQFDESRRDSHLRAHAALERHLAGLIERHEAGGENVVMDIVTFMRDWILNHVMKTDSQYRPFIRAAGHLKEAGEAPHE